MEKHECLSKSQGNALGSGGESREGAENCKMASVLAPVAQPFAPPPPALFSPSPVSAWEVDLPPPSSLSCFMTAVRNKLESFHPIPEIPEQTSDPGGPIT